MKQASNFQRKLISRGAALSRSISASSLCPDSEQDWTERRAPPLSSGCAGTEHPCYHQPSIFMVKSNGILFVFWEAVAVRKAAGTWITKHLLKISHGTSTVHSRARSALQLPKSLPLSSPGALSTSVPFTWVFFQAPQSTANGRSDNRPVQRNFTQWLKPLVLHPILLFLWCFFQLAKENPASTCQKLFVFCGHHHISQK